MEGAQAEAVAAAAGARAGRHQSTQEPQPVPRPTNRECMALIDTTRLFISGLVCGIFQPSRRCS